MLDGAYPDKDERAQFLKASGEIPLKSRRQGSCIPPRADVPATPAGEARIEVCGVRLERSFG